MATEFGKTAAMLESVATTKTPLQESLDKVGSGLASAALVIVGIIVVLGLYRGQPFMEMLIFGIALAVAAVPEALPAVVTISLALGVQRMVKRNALMRRLPAVETLGSTSVICSDKTGTLTRDEMTVRQVYVAKDLFEISGAGFEPHGKFTRAGSVVEPPEPLKLLLRAAALTSDARLARSNGRWQIKGDPTEGALVVLAAKAGLKKIDLEAQFPRVHEVPFSSEAKRMTTLHRSPSGLVAYAKGAPEIILESCASRLTYAGEEMLDPAGREALSKTAREMASQALRVLAVAYKSNATLEDCEHDMVFVGLVGMIDPPRSEARAAIQQCTQAGIKTVMITGDHPVTAEAVARELGLLNTGRVITGSELEALSEPNFERAVENISVYARVSPAHKLRVVTALQKKDHVVAMTGDGVNDAPALKKADIGIAMGITGTEVSKEAAAMTLIDDNFAFDCRGRRRRTRHFQQHQEISDVSPLLEHWRDRSHARRCAAGSAAAVDRRTNSLRQPRHRWVARVGAGSGPARRRSHASPAEKPAHRHLHSAGDYFDGDRRIMVNDGESAAFPLVAFHGPESC